MGTWRELVPMCARRGTYKYFLQRDQVRVIWEKLASTYGAIERNEKMMTMEIESRALILRATTLGNPITVFRKRACTDADVEAFHALVGLEVSTEPAGDGKAEH